MKALCSHSISLRLSRKLAIFTMVMLAALFVGAWLSVKMMITQKNAEDARFRGNVIAQILELELQRGGEQACLARVRADAPMRANTRLELWRADGTPFYADEAAGSHAMSAHTQSVDFDIPAPQLSFHQEHQYRGTMNMNTLGSLGGMSPIKSAGGGH